MPLPPLDLADLEVGEVALAHCDPGGPGKVDAAASAKLASRMRCASQPVEVELSGIASTAGSSSLGTRRASCVREVISSFTNT